MKKLIIFAVIILVAFTLPSFRLAASPTPDNATSSASPSTQQIDQSIQERIASRVAQLKLVDKRGIIGTVTDVSQTQITLSDVNGNIRFVDVDELTKFSSPSAKPSFGISDITKGTTVGVLGLYNKESRRLLARFVDVLTLPNVYDGGIESLDNTNYNITLVTNDNKTYTVSVEDITKTVAYTGGAGLIKSGFSKLQEGQRIIVVGFPDVSNSKTIIASRIIVLPNLPVDPIVKLAPQALKATTQITPSTGSGMKLVPIVK